LGGFFEVALQVVHVTLRRGEVGVSGHALDDVHRYTESVEELIVARCRRDSFISLSGRPAAAA